MADLEQMVGRQRALAEFGELALRSDDLDEVLQEACRIVGDALGTDLSKMLGIHSEKQELLDKAGVGWAEPRADGPLADWLSRAAARCC